MIECSVYSPENLLSYKSLLKYNEEGNVIEKTESSYRQNNTTTVTTKYDNNGNVLQRPEQDKERNRCILLNINTNLTRLEIG